MRIAVGMIVKLNFIQPWSGGTLLGQTLLNIISGSRNSDSMGANGVSRFGNAARSIAAGLLLVIAVLAMALKVAPAFAASASPAAAASPSQAAPSPAAQASAAPAAAPQAQASPTGIEEIVVTAQKREQLSQDVPIALTAFTRSTLELRGINDMSDLQMQVPGMAYAYDDGATQQIFIRGIGVDDVTGDIESPIATYVDGVYQTRDFRAPTLGIDVDQVEVLKGPQGTLFGRNATGGAINIKLLPPTDELTAIVKAGTGSYGQYLTQGSISGPLIKNLLDLRVSGAVSRDGGWVINEVNDRAVNDHLEGDGRVALAFKPLDNLSVDYELLLSKLVGGGVPGLATNIQMGTPAIQKAAGFPVSPIPTNDYINGNNPWKGKFDYPFTGDEENTQNAGTVKWDLAPWASLKSITAFQEHTLGGERADGDGTSYPIYTPASHNVDDKYFSQELNLLGTRDVNFLHIDQPWTWILGAYYGHEEYANFFPQYYIFHSELLGGAGGHEKLNDYSVFGDTTIPLPWHFSLFGGLRYTYDRKALNQTVSLQFSEGKFPIFGPPFTPPQNIPGATCKGVEYVDNDHNISPRVGMGWALNETVNFYVKYSEGYNSGGHYYNGCNNGYNPETVDTIEGGVKGRWFGDRLTFDAAGYYNNFKDFQIFQVVPVAGVAETRVINAPKAEMWGGEFELAAIPFENAKANVGISIMHSQYEDFHDEDLLNPKAGLQNLSGNQMERAPNHTEFIGLEYAFQIPWSSVLGDSTRHFLDLGPLRVRGEWFHTDYIVFRPFGNTGFAGANDRQNPYSIFNFYAQLPTEDEKWSLRFFAKNFTATKYYSYKVADPWGYVGTGGMPQWFGGDLTYRF